jgi:diphthine synthase
VLYIIGLGLNERAFLLKELEAIEKCSRIYLENYTVNFPYSIEKLEKTIGSKIIPADRSLVESNELIKEAKKEDIALLVYGSPLTATTHIALVQEAKKEGINHKIIYNASILDSVGECGLQLYKFGKITSIPNFGADSFIDAVRKSK